MGQPCCTGSPKGNLVEEHVNIKGTRCCATCCAQPKSMGANPTVVLVEDEDKAYKPFIPIVRASDIAPCMHTSKEKEEMLDARTESESMDRISSATPATGSRADGGTSSRNSGSWLDDDAALELKKFQAKSIIKRWILDMIKGVDYPVVTPNGPGPVCTVSISRELDTISIARNGQKRDILLYNIVSICGGPDVPGISLPLTDLCVTVTLVNQASLSFLCTSLDSRDTFVSCLSLMVERAKSGQRLGEDSQSLDGKRSP
mmetsp:Transcript_43346/g.99892  ORF Transcript_43346/g.99892 Transcript_43346/m.99892 type:complete len:259 (-) Transcript_43346:50-826(-)